MVYFSTYEQLKKAWVPCNEGIHDTFSFAELAAGIIAGGTGALVTQPLDFAKTRIQVGQQRLSDVLVKNGTAKSRYKSLILVVLSAPPRPSH